MACATLALTASASGSVKTQSGAAARLSGLQEVTNQGVPGQGDPDGTGQAGFSLDSTLNRVCYAVQVSKIAPATVAHIHQGAAGVNGPIVVDLIAPTSGASGGCASPRPNAPPGTIQAIINNPSAYYVNVHNGPFPAGAVRGQLS